MKLNRDIAFLVGLSIFATVCCQAGDSMPGQGYPASRYETLWTKSPFAVATPEAADQESEFSLEGIANLDGIDYASLVNKQSGERYLLASGKPQNGLSLVSVTHGEDRDKTFAVVQNNGQTLTLKLSDTTSATPTVAEAPMTQAPNTLLFGRPGMSGQTLVTSQGANPGMYPQIRGGFPSTMSSQPGGGFPSTMSPQPSAAGTQFRPNQPPMPLIRHPIIHVPAPPPQ